MERDRPWHRAISPQKEPVNSAALMANASLSPQCMGTGRSCWNHLENLLAEKTKNGKNRESVKKKLYVIIKVRRLIINSICLSNEKHILLHREYQMQKY